VVVEAGDPRPIGVFDSGVGGLTVARAIIDLLPHESVIYVGDSARFPYGPRPLDEIRTFALQIAGYLISRDVKILVVACNSVQVSAIGDITVRSTVPVIGVIDPGARAAARATRTGVVGVIGTQATIKSGAYQRALGSQVRLHAASCPVFVEHVERGDTTSDVLRRAAAEYLSPLKEAGIDTLILGCTHYPLLSGLIQMELGPGVVLVSSAEETAKDVYATLVSEGLEAPAGSIPKHEFLCTGDEGRFEELAGLFLGPETSDLEARRIEPEPAWS
jgi:glutamate racemase